MPLGCIPVACDVSVNWIAMAKIFITGSASGLGFLAGQHLVTRGHQVVLHARDAGKAAEIQRALPKASGVVVGDLERISEVLAVAVEANALGRFDAVIHNAGVGERGTGKLTGDGLPVVFAVNALAPYLLTVLMHRPDRLVYLSSSMHFGARPNRLADFWQGRTWHGQTDYSQTKFLDTALAFAVARLWPSVRSNAVDPGWVPTRMGGSSAPDDLEEGYITQAWLAEGTDPEARVTGQYLGKRRVLRADAATHDRSVQDDFLALCRNITGIAFPTPHP